MDPADRLCKICSAQERRYVCPRCGIPYCSLKCYQNLEKHVKCSESFYRDCVVESIEEEKDPLKAKKMQEVLQRFHNHYDEEDEDLQDSDDDEPLAKRMEGIDLNDSDQVWSSLTLEEREEFKRFVHQNEGKDVIPEWTPWWTQPVKNIRIQEVRDGETLESLLAKGHKEKLNEEQPDILDPIPKMESLTKVKPNDTVKLGLTNIIGAYVWAARLFSGDIANPDEPEEVAFAIINLSSCILNDQVFTLYQDAVSDVSFKRLQDLLDGGPSLQQNLNQDVLLILRSGAPELPVNAKKNYSKSFVFSVLSECYKLFYQLVTKARKAKASEIITRKKAALTAATTSSTGSNITTSAGGTSSESFSKLFPTSIGRYALDPNMYRKALRKIQYLLAFVHEFDIW